MDYTKPWWLKKNGVIIETFDLLRDALKRGADLTGMLPSDTFKVERGYL